ncbi:hypothetical protein [Sphaerisporangium dianthi]|uniref:DUF4333 domain-containing protein n=1 Tax=Sphaerisporangium dianthi TaxID=1436120 RepID=A0ABV9CIN8_9ACTN
MMDRRSQAEQRLSAGLRAADDAIVVPDGLESRVMSLRPGRVVRRTRWAPLAAAAVVAVIMMAASFGAGALWMRGHDQVTPPFQGDGDPLVLTVYNGEVPCRALRTLECSLGLMKDPRGPLIPGNVVARVWHGDRVVADCVVADGTLIADEAGISTRRWYHVTLEGTRVTGWLPGIRTRNTTEVAACRS